MLQKPIYIGNDHGGYELKQSIMEHLKKRGIAYIDTGSSTREIVRYPYYAAKIAGAVSIKKPLGSLHGQSVLPFSPRLCSK